MSYNFTFDLSVLSHHIFKEIAEFSEKAHVNTKIARIAKRLVQRFKIDQLTGLSITESILIIKDILHVNIKNNMSRDLFLKTNKRALFLPHCCRKYMDTRCKATFNAHISSYECQHCSQDCLVHKATQLAAHRNYDVYILPGASGVQKILHQKSYDGIVGIACTEELRFAMNLLEKHRHISTQGIPLIKNGCSQTMFNFETLSRILIEGFE
ncbi:MAG: DUF116 domain-containing protein [Candidatus Thermoplasmatota archaeon]